MNSLARSYARLAAMVARDLCVEQGMDTESANRRALAIIVPQARQTAAFLGLVTQAMLEAGNTAQRGDDESMD